MYENTSFKHKYTVENVIKPFLMSGPYLGPRWKWLQSWNLSKGNNNNNNGGKNLDVDLVIYF